jgi:hypothetical protein|tara:strand:+ start:278 stop:472 length:195 start_codon:yes stop_codon:yes gene_type:complete
MKKFRFYAEDIEYMVCEIEADTKEDAIDIVKEGEDVEWKSCNDCDWIYNWSLTEEITENESKDN